MLCYVSHVHSILKIIYRVHVNISQNSCLTEQGLRHTATPRGHCSQSHVAACHSQFSSQIGGGGGGIGC